MAKGSGNTGALIGQRIGRYDVLALLALGGTAEIYLARISGAAGFEKFVVIKCLHEHLADDAEFVSMFLDEARLAAQLDHSNIVQTFELGEWRNRYFMALEFLGGLSLAMMVRRAAERTANGIIPVTLSLALIQQACAGLHYAHERQNAGEVLNVVHRDISPQNLVVTFEGVLKVVDFGIARAEQRETRTRAGTIKGKFAYMSPEQCISHNVDRRTDVFALGVVLYELVTGTRLFKRQGQYETYQAVMECVVPAPSSQNLDLDPALDAVILKALAKDREQRYPTADAFGDAILQFLHARNVYAGPGDVARFMDVTYAHELEEHGGRMRELLAGRHRSEGELDWDEEISADLVEASGVHAVTLEGADPVSAPVAARNEPPRLASDMGELDDADVESVDHSDAVELSTDGDLPRGKARPPASTEARTMADGGMGLPAPRAPRPASKFGDGPGLGTALSELDISTGASAVGVPAPEPPRRPSGPGVTMAARPSALNLAVERAPLPAPAPAPAPLLSLPQMPSAIMQFVPPAPDGAHADVELAHLAMQPFRRLPTWMMVACFVTAVGLAMAITLVIARLLR